MEKKLGTASRRRERERARVEQVEKITDSDVSK